MGTAPPNCGASRSTDSSPSDSTRRSRPPRASASSAGWRTAVRSTLWARGWLALLAKPLPAVASALTEDTEEMRDLRQNTPFAGVLTPQERWRILSDVR